MAIRIIGSMGAGLRLSLAPRKTGVKEAVHHMRVEFVPKDTAVISTLDRIKSAGEHAYGLTRPERASPRTRENR